MKSTTKCATKSVMTTTFRNRLETTTPEDVEKALDRILKMLDHPSPELEAQILRTQQEPR